jgi:hypothetical protein
MKYIAIVPPQPVRHPITGVEVGKLDQNEMMLNLTLTPEFAGSKRGIEVTELLSGARQAIREQKASSLELGYYALEDAHGKALKEAAEKFEVNAATAEAVHPHLVAIVNQKSEKPAAAIRPVETNGAAAQEHAPS